jgi:hypothetical protein
LWLDVVKRAIEVAYAIVPDIAGLHVEVKSSLGRKADLLDASEGQLRDWDSSSEQGLR